MANIYTKTGDNGTTALIGGSRVSKADLRVECYGTVDEANSMLGLAYAESQREYVRETVHAIQKKLFSLAAELACDESGRSGLKWRIEPADVEFLEGVVDKCTEINGVQTHFVIPGVNRASAALHVARTIVRRAERNMLRLKETMPLDELLLRYVNRLSDAVYALARLEETMTKEDELREKVSAIVREKLGELQGGDMPFTLENIKKIAERAEQKAAEIGVPVVFAAVDAGGVLKYLNRMEGAFMGSVDVAEGKAYTANAFKMPTQTLGEAAAPGEPLYGIENTNGGKIVLFGGGYPFVYKGEVVGGVGVSGGTVDEDLCVIKYALNIN